jgi:hypothetical protein
LRDKISAELPFFLAFIVVVVLLVIIIVSVGTAMVILLREDKTMSEAQDRRRRYHRAGLPASQLDSSSSNTWLSSLAGIFSSSRREADTTTDGPTMLKGRGAGQGWVQAAGSDWDGDSVDERARIKAGVLQSVRMAEYGSPGASSSFVGQPFHSPRLDSLMSEDTESSSRLDLHGVGGLPYHDPYSPSPQLSMFNTQRLSPNSTPPESPRPRHINSQSALQGDTTSPDDIGNATTVFHPNDSGQQFTVAGNSTLLPGEATPPDDDGNVTNDPHLDGSGQHFVTHSGNSMRTFHGGTKFIEAL